MLLCELLMVLASLPKKSQGIVRLRKLSESVVYLDSQTRSPQVRIKRKTYANVLVLFCSAGTVEGGQPLRWYSSSLGVTC